MTNLKELPRLVVVFSHSMIAVPEACLSDLAKLVTILGRLGEGLSYHAGDCSEFDVCNRRFTAAMHFAPKINIIETEGGDE